MGGGVWMWLVVTATVCEISQTGGSPASLGTIASVYDWVYEIHSILGTCARNTSMPLEW